MLVHPNHEPGEEGVSTLNLQPIWVGPGTAQVFFFQHMENGKFERGKIKESVFLITLFSGKKEKKKSDFLY
jgi:hypothetical protein